MSDQSFPVQWYARCECGRLVSTVAPVKPGDVEMARIRCLRCRNIVRATEYTNIASNRLPDRIRLSQASNQEGEQ